MVEERRIQWVEVSAFYSQDMYCMFCGAKVQDMQEVDTGDVHHPCRHTLYIASDAGFEHFAPELLPLLNWSEKDLKAFHEGPIRNVDELTDKLTIAIPDAIKILFAPPAPGCGAYFFGFAPQ